MTPPGSGRSSSLTALPALLFLWAAAGPGAIGAETAAPLHGPTDTLRIVEERTTLAAIVQTEGIAARFAPDHLIRAPASGFTLVLDPSRPEAASLRGEVQVAELGVDEPGLQRELQDRLVELGLLDDPYDEMSEGDRERVRGHMVDEGQLHASEHPTIQVEAGGLRHTGEEPFPWEGTVGLTVRGIRVEAPFRARLEREEEGRVRVEAHATFRFTDFGIAPYRAFLGAVRNRDEFSLYLTLLADEAAVAPPRPTRSRP